MRAIIHLNNWQIRGISGKYQGITGESGLGIQDTQCENNLECFSFYAYFYFMNAKEFKIIVLFVLSDSILVFSQGVPVFSEKSLSAKSEYSIQVWNTDHGLPQNSVTDIIQTSDGFLWIATFDGLVRYDGYQFRIYKPSEHFPSITNRIYKLFEDSNKLWIVTQDKDLLKIDKEEIILQEDLSNAGLSGAVSSFYNDLVGSDEQPVTTGLYPVFFIHKRGFPVSIFRNNEKILFIKGNDTLRFRIPDAIRNFSVRDVYADANENIYFLTSGGLYIKHTGNNLTRFSTAEGLSSDDIYSICLDSDSNLWIGTNGGGLHKIKRKTFVTYSKEDGLIADGIGPVIESYDGSIWVGNNCGGLNQLIDGKIKQVKLTHNSCIWSLLEDKNKSLWIGTYGGGLFHYHEGKIIESEANKIPGDIIFALYQDNQGIIWIGTEAGVGTYYNGVYSIFHNVKNATSYILQDKTGRMWFATNDGIKCYDNQAIITYSVSNGLSNNFVRCLYEDSKGIIWAGTMGGGLNRIDKSNIVAFHPSNGFIDDNVHCIIEDELGYLWLSSNKGLFAINKSELDSVAENKLSSFTTAFFGKEDGIINTEFNGGFQPSVLKSSDGLLWFPTIKGVVSVDPRKVNHNSTYARLIIEKITNGKKDYFDLDNITFSYPADKVEIYYATPSFSAGPGRIKYKLSGFQNDWTDQQIPKNIIFPSLPPGEYQLHLQIPGTNHELSVPLRISPPYWQTAWFIVLCLASFLLLLAALMIYRVNLIRKKEKEKTILNKKFARLELKALQTQMNPHFIFNCLNSIQQFILTNNEIEANRYLTKFSSLIRMFLEQSRTGLIPLHGAHDKSPF